uniref:Uncharacterized protein n=1 Tax=Rhodosorus marinus TaxID=101924 RepID=A0A7S3E775_9RHOD|mmetsp:Transcript_1145/g.3216  ORF Transcript_1145/g.3216 Transcript_1145/m.3216 type:complete len:496 (+) Transcript_1145:187-1674(+)|eukprot:CAMPEP_0113956246 /NCGR_PEP_ID=MMETSP0011_2-20120614/1932_1 /TAXON_ID=101924 /ORGANISM="Rhodosorus marinus" /LENGTH=495 /DNA_ID=CAMNT_0000966325 /DNA_START=103 /DNA_END=1590 /DNA_ORIENTATION=- /assembly_acc=CAM_ASM_000156
MGEVEEALRERRAGNLLQFNLIEHKLFGEDVGDRVRILEELDKLSAGDAVEDEGVQLLLGQVLGFEASRVVRPDEVFRTYVKLLLNLASSNASYVEACLAAFSRLLFLPREFAQVREEVILCIQRVLGYHSAAPALFCRMLAKTFPHQRRSVEDIVNFSSALLLLAERTTNGYLSEQILLLIVERITIIDAEAASKGGAIEESLREKLDNMLYLTFLYIEEHVSDSSAKGRVQFEHVYAAFEKSILPAYRSFTAPYILFYLCGRSQRFLSVVDDRLRAIFYDRELPAILRKNAILYSTGLMSRLSQADNDLILRWLRSVVNFLHSNLDACDADLEAVETDIRSTYYVAFACAMHVLVRRGGSFIMHADNAESLRQLRLAAIMRSRLKPLSVQATPLAEEFCDLLTSFDIVDCTNMNLDGGMGTATSRTSWGRRNRVELHLPFEPVNSLELSLNFLTMYHIGETAAGEDEHTGKSCDMEVRSDFDSSLSEAVKLVQ